MYNPYADMYEDWMPPCPQEEQSAEEWIEYMDQKQHDE